MTDISTRLLQPDDSIPDGFASLSHGVFHASTILFPDVASFLQRQSQIHDGYSYGQNGTPTYYALANKLAEFEGGGKTALVPSGLAAAVLVNSAVLSKGDHVLLPEGIYGPTLEATRILFGKWGVQFTIYPNDIGSGITGLFTPATRLVWIESPASNTLEMQDVPAIVASARAHGLLVAMDNTWATPLGFRPLDVGVDFSVQALTKYVGGHSDLMMGAVTTRNDVHYKLLRDTAELLGYYVSPDECFLALRGLPTMPLRLERHFCSALRVARWLECHPAVAKVNYPPLESSPWHALWKRDYQFGSGMLSFVLKELGLRDVERFVGALKLFRLGNSWGGIHSLVAVMPARQEHGIERTAKTEWLIRLHVGIEDARDLVDDLMQAISSI
jgi:cystathionine beta-lyase